MKDLKLTLTEPKVLTKFYQFVMLSGHVTEYFYTEDLSQIWTGTMSAKHSHNELKWVRTNCYIEVKV